LTAPQSFDPAEPLPLKPARSASGERSELGRDSLHALVDEFAALHPDALSLDAAVRRMRREAFLSLVAWCLAVLVPAFLLGFWIGGALR
jgi:hypothetical protein